MSSSRNSAASSAKHAIQLQQLRSALNGLNEDDLVHTFNMLIAYSDIETEKTCKMISYKCYESAYVCNGKKANGYGRNEKEANVNCIRNLLEFLLEDEAIATAFCECLSQISIDSKAKVSETPLINKKGPSVRNSFDSYPNGQRQITQPNTSSSNSSSNRHHSQSVHIPNQGTSPLNMLSKNLPTDPHQVRSHSSHSANKSGGSSITMMNGGSQNLNMSVQHESGIGQVKSSNFYHSINLTTLKDCQDSSKSSNSVQQQQIYPTWNSNNQNKYTSNSKTTAADETSDRSVLQSHGRHSRNRTLNASAHLASESKYQQLEEELAKSKTYIEHLERKVQLVTEENKILKSLLMENKKTAAAAVGLSSMKEKMPQHHQSSMNQQTSANVTISSHTNLHNTTPSVAAAATTTTTTTGKHYSNAQKSHHTNENMPPVVSSVSHESGASTFTSANKKIASPFQKNYNFPSPQFSKGHGIVTHFGATHGSNQTNGAAPHNTSIGLNSHKSCQNNNNNNNNNMNLSSTDYSSKKRQNTMPTVPMEPSQISVLKDFSNKANISSNSNNNASLYSSSTTGNVIKKPSLSFSTQQHNYDDDDEDEEIIHGEVGAAGLTTNADYLDSKIESLNHNNHSMYSNVDKSRSLSVDIHARRSTLGADTPKSKLDTSYNETSTRSSGMSSLLGHKKNQSRIPKLNLEILPNYHGKSNSSMNQQLLVSYQANTNTISNAAGIVTSSGASSGIVLNSNSTNNGKQTSLHSQKHSEKVK